MKEYLPIGTVVILKGGRKPIMIYGRKQKHVKTEELLDYVACLYPEGHISEEFNYLFNHNQIEEVLYTGYRDEKEEAFLEMLEKVESDVSADYKEELEKIQEELEDIFSKTAGTIKSESIFED